jgi:acetyl esterase/lipase
MLRDAISQAKTQLDRQRCLLAKSHDGECRQIAQPEVDGRADMVRFSMKTTLAICVLAVMMAAASARMPNFDWKALRGGPLRAGLVVEADNTSPAAADKAKTCEHVAFTRSIKYGDSDRNVLDVAAADASDGTPRPVLLFVAGDSFSDDGAQADSDGSLLQQAMCFAAQNGMVAVNVSYRLAPTASWPAGAKDVAAATSWVHQSIDLFGGNPQETVLIGYAAGAFHVASFLAHREFQADDSDIAGVVLVSGLYHAGTDASDSERSYLGADASKYNDRSAFPGILEVDVPIVLAWSFADPQALVAQGEKLKEKLCGAGHCPRTALLANRGSPASVFDLDGSSEDLAERTRQLLSQIEARGLP